ncbi:acetate--CoA ligase [Pseudonocardia hydrocarbonoxydans]|uniref:acetate--CoA ligase n=1 Tax=Pseudonocardia hydrocarbonoxydans TaxID=76726 RepID=A0A4Y3WP75_9PSEU|nr:acetate--CoA ligase [Pseudonocardia hydrocarbonoxydans]GEC20071.1 acetyl-coenzyme A synthetase [Pseudonocardia hydrocarbonoxydans]
MQPDLLRGPGAARRPAPLRGRADPGSAWEAARADLDGLPGGAGLNIAHEAVDRHAADPARAGRVAVRWLDRSDTVHDLTYRDLAGRTARFAHLLARLGVGPGERVFTLLGRVPALHVTVLGALKARCVVSPLFSAFGPAPVRERMRLGGAAVLVTTPQLYRRTIAPIRAGLPDLRHVLLTGGDGSGGGEPGTLDLDALLDAEEPTFTIGPTDPQDPALLHFTSGTTGTPKGALHVHEAVVAHLATARAALDLRPDDLFWCTADPGWVTGTSYGIVAPLVVGATLLSDQGEFDALRWYRTLEREGVTVWYTAPTAIRMLMRRGEDGVPALPRLRLVASVGEPLDPDAVRWTARVLGRAAHDTWWQTETGAIMIAHRPGDDVVPGSMGRPLPGVQAGLLARGPDGRAAVGAHGGVHVLHGVAEGELALRTGWPSMFRAYLGAPERYAACFADGWYLTGDIARRDLQGHYRFVARADDVIKSAGHLIGPFEVESVLTAHPAVVEAGVIGTPDPVAGELVKAFVTLRAGTEPTEELRAELLAHARRALGVVAPKEIVFADALPHTRSGKVMRRLLRARELGLPDGDLSTLETAR